MIWKRKWNIGTLILPSEGHEGKKAHAVIVDYDDETFSYVLSIWRDEQYERTIVREVALETWEYEFAHRFID